MGVRNYLSTRYICRCLQRNIEVIGVKIKPEQINPPAFGNNSNGLVLLQNWNSQIFYTLYFISKKYLFLSRAETPQIQRGNRELFCLYPCFEPSLNYSSDACMLHLAPDVKNPRFSLEICPTAYPQVCRIPKHSLRFVEIIFDNLGLHRFV